MRSSYSTFNIYEDDRLIFTGTEPEIKNRFGLKDSRRLSWYANTKGKLNRRYRVEYDKKVPVAYRFNFYKDGVLIYTGTNQEFKRRFQLNFKGSASSYAYTHSKIMDMYEVEVVGDERNDFVKKDAMLEKLTKRLTEYGNTYSKKNPKPYIEKLKERGLNCIYRKCMDNDGFIVEVA